MAASGPVTVGKGRNAGSLQRHPSRGAAGLKGHPASAGAGGRCRWRGNAVGSAAVEPRRRRSWAGSRACSGRSRRSRSRPPAPRRRSPRRSRRLRCCPDTTESKGRQKSTQRATETKRSPTHLPPEKKKRRCESRQRAHAGAIGGLVLLLERCPVVLSPSWRRGLPHGAVPRAAGALRGTAGATTFGARRIA